MRRTSSTRSATQQILLVGIAGFIGAFSAFVSCAIAEEKPEPAEVIPAPANPPRATPLPASDLNIDEPDFKVTVITGAATTNVDSRAKSPATNPATGAGSTPPKWAISTEEDLTGNTNPASQTQPTAKADAPAKSDPAIHQEVKEQISDLLARAISKEHGRSDPDLAALFQEVVNAEPENAAAYYRLGLALAKSGELLKGLNALDRSVTLSPTVAKYQCDYGLTLLHSGFLDKALSAVRKAALACPGNARYESALGDCLLAAGRTAQASAAYARAISLDPNNPNYIYNLGISYLHTGAYKRSMELFDEAIRMRPERSEFYCGRGLARESHGDMKEAILDYRLATKLDDRNAYAHYLLGVAFSDPVDETYANRFESVEHADKAVKLTHFHNAKYLMGMARALSSGRQYALAVETAQKAVALDPSEANRKQLAEYQRKMKTDGF